MRPLDEPTAGSLCLKASGDSHIYDPLEIAYGMTDKVMMGISECIEAHEHIFNEDEFFVVLQRASDPILKNVMRQKFYADLFLPEPRPEQMVCLYNRRTLEVTRLWSLPNAKVMAIVSEMPWVDQKWVNTKYWCDAFFSGQFFERIRDQYKFNHLSRLEYLDRNREEVVKARGENVNFSLPQTRDRFEIGINEIVNPLETGI